MKTKEDESGRPLDPARLPHQPPMRWIRAARLVSEDRVVAEAMLPAECGEDGRADVLLGLEVLAQAAGLLLAASGGAGEQPREGRLLQVKEARWKAASVPLATPLEANVERLGGSAIGLHQFSGTLSAGADVLLEAEFSLLVPNV